MSMSVIAANFGLIASPVSAVANRNPAMLAGLHVSALDILSVTVPGTLLGCLAGCFYSSGKMNWITSLNFSAELQKEHSNLLRPGENKDRNSVRKSEKGLVIFYNQHSACRSDGICT